MLKVLAIMGSPRRKKNNDALLDQILAGIQTKEVEVTKYSVSTLRLTPCSACGRCGQQLGCVYQDDMGALYEQFNQSDIIVITSPLYFNSISGQLKTVIDRCQALWSSKYILNNSLIDRSKKRIGYFVCTAGEKERSNLFDATLPILDLFFKAINTRHVGSLFISNVDEIPTYTNEGILRKAYEAGIALTDYYLND